MIVLPIVFYIAMLYLNVHECNMNAACGISKCTKCIVRGGYAGNPKKCLACETGYTLYDSTTQSASLASSCKSKLFKTWQVSNLIWVSLLQILYLKFCEYIIITNVLLKLWHMCCLSIAYINILTIWQSPLLLHITRHNKIQNNLFHVTYLKLIIESQRVTMALSRLS
jgi:hypothetical protein